MLNQLLETIIQILTGWLNKFDSHTQHVEDKLDSLDQTASDIKTNTDPISDIADNTGAVITPIQNIKSNTDSIATSSQTSANNTTAILNNVGTLSTNTGRAAAFAEDCANNTLEIKDKITTIASDTTQIRANTAAIEDIKDLMQYYFINTIVTEDSEGPIANFDTDLEDYLQKAIVMIPEDPTGYTGITLTKTKKNINPYDVYNPTPIYIWGTNFASLVTLLNTLPAGTYTLSNKYKVVTLPGNNKVQYGKPYIRALVNGNYIYISAYSVTTDNSPAVGKIYETNTTFTITPEVVGNIANVYLYCDQDTTHSGADRGTYAAYDYQLEIGENYTPFESYTAVTYPVSFGTAITDGAEVDLLNGLVKVNTTPESFIQIQPIAVRTYKGVNNIFSDVGSTTLTYRETLKKYIEKHNQ